MLSYVILNITLLGVWQMDIFVWIRRFLLTSDTTGYFCQSLFKLNKYLKSVINRSWLSDIILFVQKFEEAK